MRFFTTTGFPRTPVKRAHPVLVVLSICLLAGGCKMVGGVKSSTEAIDANRRAIEESTTGVQAIGQAISNSLPALAAAQRDIERAAAVIEAARPPIESTTAGIKKAALAIDESGASLGDINRVLTDSARALEDIGRRIEQSSLGIETNRLTIAASTKGIRENADAVAQSTVSLGRIDQEIQNVLRGVDQLRAGKGALAALITGGAAVLLLALLSFLVLLWKLNRAIATLAGRREHSRADPQ